MRIAFVTEVWRPSINGVVTRLAATVIELRKAGHEVLIIAPEGGETDFYGAVVRGMPTISVGFIYAGQPWGWPLVGRVLRWLRDFVPDVVHVVNPVFLGIAGVVAASRAKLPLVASYHTDVPKYAAFYHLGWASGGIWRVVRALHNRASVNLATSATALEELRSHGVRSPQLWVRGVDADLFNPSRRPGLRASFTDDPTVAVALYVGRLGPEKGLERLAPLAGAAGIHLVVVGKGPEEERLRDLMEGPSVTFTGPLLGAELADAYAGADVFVFPSTTETLGLVILEAMAAGLPVVAAETPASAELLSTCPANRLFPPDQPELLPKLVAEVLGSMSLAERTDALRAQVDRFTWAAATEGLLAHYRAEVASGPGRS
ncbi:MAG: glycosyltransferase family 4 protein [Acidimicrobiales bacterium]